MNGNSFVFVGHKNSVIFLRKKRWRIIIALNEMGIVVMCDQNRTVYSTEWGRICLNCGEPIKECKCKQVKKIVANDGFVRLQRQTKGRNGKPVSIIRGVPLAEKELKSLHRELKQLCGCGGTIKDGVMEIQGDHHEKIAARLSQKGYKVKLAGG